MNLKHLLSGVLLIIFSVSCSTKNGGLFSKKTPREKYEDAVEDKYGKSNPVYNKWLDFGEWSLNHPLTVAADYAEAGRFSADLQTASSFVVEVKRGQKISVSFAKTDTSNFGLYMDIWRPGDSLLNEKPSYIAAADTLANYLEHIAARDEKILVRFQQAIGAAGNYEFRMETGPSFYFPIAATVKSNIGSFWGVDRDGGARKHEGVDIFAPKFSPAVAVADGLITSVTESTLGGKVVFLQPANSEYNVYYAHLDTQLVRTGQRVKKGDVLGLTGNTGNAKFTASHLHFGIYTYGGAIDPLLFIKPEKTSSAKLSPVKKPSLTLTKNSNLLQSLSDKSKGYPLTKNEALKAEAFTQGYYRVITSEGYRGFVSAAAVK